MYGTIAHLRPIAGQEDAMVEYGRYWETERKPHIPGAIGGHMYRLDADPGVWVMTVVFADKESYVANAQSAAMDADYRRLRALLTEDPVWEDGEIVASF